MAAQAAERALFQAWKVAQSTSSAAAAEKASSPTQGSSADSDAAKNLTPSPGLDLRLDSGGQGKVQGCMPREVWQQGTSGATDWDFGLPHSVETPEYLAIICPPGHKKLIQDGVYINLASFIPKDPGEAQTSTMNWSFAEGAMKTTTVVRQVKDIDEWTDAFSRYAAIYCQAHPYRGTEMWRYLDVIRQAKRKWGGMGWRAYDEQFRALQAVHPRSWAQVDHSLWSMCVTCPQLQAAPVAHQNAHQNANTSQPKKQKGGNNGGAMSNNSNGANSNKGKFQNGGYRGGPNANTCRDYQMGVCKRHKCKYPHICVWCNGPHPGDQCPNKR